MKPPLYIHHIEMVLQLPNGAKPSAKGLARTLFRVVLGMCSQHQATYSHVSGHIILLSNSHVGSSEPFSTTNL